MFISLFLGIWAGWVIISGGNVFTGLGSAIQACIDVFKDAGNTRVIIFSSFIGALIMLTQRNGGVQGFVEWIQRRNLVQTRCAAAVLAWVIGMAIFIESSITCLVTGAVSRPIFERFKISREKLVYICDSTWAPVCILIPLNASGAMCWGCLTAKVCKIPSRYFFKRCRSIFTPFSQFCWLGLSRLPFAILVQ